MRQKQCRDMRLELRSFEPRPVPLSTTDHRPPFMWDPKKYRLFQLNPWNIVLIYLVLGFLWILFSDRILEQLVDDPATLTQFQTYKGWFYVLVTGFLLLGLLMRYTDRITNMRGDFVKRFDLYRSLLEQGNQVVLQVDDNQSFSYSNTAVKDVLGYDQDEFRCMDDFESIAHHEELDRFSEIRKVCDAGLRDHEPVIMQIRMRHKDGSWRWFRMILTDKRGFEHIQSRLLLIRDIHEETTLYEQLRESKQRFEHLFQEAPVGYHSFGSDFIIIDINKAEQEMLGYAREEIVGKKTWADLIVPEDLPMFEQQKKDLLEKGFVENLEYSIVRKDGTMRSVILNARAFFDEHDRLLFTLGNVVDMTDKLLAEKELNEAYRRLAYHIQNTPLGFVEWNSSFGVTEWSAESEKLFGWTREEVLGKKRDEWDLIHEGDRERVREEMTGMMAGNELRNVIRNRNCTKEGEVRHCVWYNSALLDKEGRLVSVMSLVHDITEQIQAQEEIRKLNVSLEAKVMERTQELEMANRELEAFAYSVSHDLRAPLRGIDGFSQALTEQYTGKLDERGLKYLDRVRKASQRMGMLIDDLLALSRITRKEIKKEKVDLAAVSTEILEAMKEKEPDRQVDFDVSKDLVVKGDANLLRILMQNLLDNAWKYTSTRERASIEVGSTELDDRNTIYVRDNGVGFNMRYHDKLFVPFQRLHTHDEFPGSGIGLATVQRIIGRHGGSIRAESKEKEGSVFYFYLPDKSV
jgi:PAS domain S-box-containing protein